MTTRFLNQRNLFDPDSVGSIDIVGVGAIGSFVALALTKMGCNAVTVWDPDKLEDHNFANQMYPIKELGTRKVEACRSMVKEFSGETIGMKYGKYVGSRANYTISCVDSMAARKQVFSNWEKTSRESSCAFIDARMGGQFYRVYCINGGFYEQRQFIEDYKNTLIDDANAVNEPCGSKSIIYTVMGVAAEVCNLVRRINLDKPVNFETIKNYDVPEVMAPVEAL
jgi:molybdopterin/thiamine biosynthesis adenylyltransferase